MDKTTLSIINKCYSIYEKFGYAAVINHIEAMRKDNIRIYTDIVYEQCPECNNNMPSLNHICLICGQTTNVQETSNTNVQVPEFIQKMDWSILREQKETLLNIINWNKLPLLNDNLQGIVHILDAIQDYAVDVAGYSETDVYLFDTDDQNESIWRGIDLDYICEEIIYVDAWLTDDDNEEGKTIAKVYPNSTVEYIDERAKTDKYAQEVINEVISKKK